MRQRIGFTSPTQHEWRVIVERLDAERHVWVSFQSGPATFAGLISPEDAARIGRALTGVCQAGAQDFLSEPLNSGDGVYRL
jgi:hypothetical protein